MANNTSIKITLDAPALTEALNKFAEALTKFAEMGRTAVLEATPEITAAVQSLPTAEPQYEQFVPQQPAQAPTAPVQPQQTQVPVMPQATAWPPQMGVQQPQQPAPVPQPVAPAPAAPTATVDPAFKNRVFNAAAALTSQGKMNDVLALLGSLGVQSAQQLSDAQIPVFAQGLQALGGVI